MQMVLSKYLAHSGVTSRRKAAELIKQGDVSVNGRMMDDPGYRVNSNDRIQVNNTSVKHEEKVYILMNKPRDYVTTVSDEKGRKTVLDLLKGAVRARLYPVGRLDRNTTGLLLLTNDGELAQRLSHPSHEVQKVYQVTLDNELADSDYQKIAQGLMLEDGKIKVDDISFVPGASNVVTIKLHSGKNRIVRRIFEYLGYEVIALDRIRFASLNKKGLVVGRWRELTRKEVEILQDDRISAVGRASADTRSPRPERSSRDGFAPQQDREQRYEGAVRDRRAPREDISTDKATSKDRVRSPREATARRNNYARQVAVSRDAVKSYSPKWPKRERVWSEGSPTQGRKTSWKNNADQEDDDDNFSVKQPRTPHFGGASREGFKPRENAAPRYDRPAPQEYKPSRAPLKPRDDRDYESRPRTSARPSRDYTNTDRSAERSPRKEWSSREEGFASRPPRSDRAGSQHYRPSRAPLKPMKPRDDRESEESRPRAGSRPSRDFTSRTSREDRPPRDHRVPRSERSSSTRGPKKEWAPRSGRAGRSSSSARRPSSYRNQSVRPNYSDE